MIIFNKTFTDNSELQKINLSRFNLTNIDLAQTSSNNLINILVPNSNTLNHANYGAKYPLAVTKDYIRLFDIWNRMLNSGFYIFNTSDINKYTLVGSGILNNKIEYLFRDTTSTLQLYLTTNNILVKFRELLIGMASELLLKVGSVRYMTGYPTILQDGYNPVYDTNLLINFGNEILSIFKKYIDTTKFNTITSLTFNDLNFNNINHLNTLINLPLISEISLDSNKWLITKLIPTNESFIKAEVTSAYIKTKDKTNRKIVGLFKYDKPLKLEKPYYFDFENNIDPTTEIWNMDLYIMFYNASACFRDDTEIGNQVPQLSATFYLVGTSNINDSKYNQNTDIKLNFRNALTTYTKIDFIDNLFCFNQLV